MEPMMLGGAETGISLLAQPENQAKMIEAIIGTILRDTPDRQFRNLCF
jgi:hypothetical protein